MHFARRLFLAAAAALALTGTASAQPIVIKFSFVNPIDSPKGKAKEKWGKLTDDELDQAAGRRDQLIGKVQERYGYARDRAEREVDEAARGW